MQNLSYSMFVELKPNYNMSIGLTAIELLSSEYCFASVIYILNS